MWHNNFRLSLDEHQFLVDKLKEPSKESDYSVGAEISRKIKNIIGKTEFDIAANVMTEVDVVTEEKRKIQEILRGQLTHAAGTEDDNESEEMDENSKMDKMIDILSTDMISHTFDEINRYKKEADRNTRQGESQKNNIAAVEHSSNNDSDEL